MATTSAKVHMISGNNDAVVCGAVRGKRTDDLHEVTCDACRCRIERMSHQQAHLVALEILDAVLRGTFVSLTSGEAKLRREWLLLAAEKAEAEIERLEESVTSTRTVLEKYQAAAAEAG